MQSASFSKNYTQKITQILSGLFLSVDIPYYD